MGAQPGHAPLRRLYAAAIAFRDLAPWCWMDDDLLIGVAEPGSGLVGYGCVMGALESVFGLAVYRGSVGFHHHQRLMAGDLEPEDIEAHAGQDCAVMTFEDRNDLTPRDRREVASAGLKPRGRNAWPMFRSARPGYLPWDLEAAEIPLLCVAVEQAVDVCGRFAADASLFARAAPATVLVRRYDFGRASWRDSWEPPPEPPPQPLAPKPAPPTIARLRRRAVPTRSAVEAQLIYLPTPVLDARGRPFLPQVWMQADHRSGIIAMSDLMEPGGTPGDIQSAFLALLEQTGELPSELLTSGTASFALLQPVAQALEVPLRLAPTPQLVEAREALEVAIGARRPAADLDLA